MLVPGEDADRARVPLGVVACPLQGLQAALQEEALLGIDHLRFPGAVAEEGGVEQVDVRRGRPGR